MAVMIGNPDAKARPSASELAAQQGRTPRWARHWLQARLGRHGVARRCADVVIGGSWATWPWPGRSPPPRGPACSRLKRNRRLPRNTSVELRGLEPLTPSMPWRCATSCATAPPRPDAGQPIDPSQPHPRMRNRWSGTPSLYVEQPQPPARLALLQRVVHVQLAIVANAASALCGSPSRASIAARRQAPCSDHDPGLALPQRGDVLRQRRAPPGPARRPSTRPRAPGRPSSPRTHAAYSTGKRSRELGAGQPGARPDRVLAQSGVRLDAQPGEPARCMPRSGSRAARSLVHSRAGRSAARYGAARSASACPHVVELDVGVSLGPAADVPLGAPVAHQHQLAHAVRGAAVAGASGTRRVSGHQAESASRSAGAASRWRRGRRWDSPSTAARAA